MVVGGGDQFGLKVGTLGGGGGTLPSIPLLKWNRSVSGSESSCKSYLHNNVFAHGTVTN